MTQKSTSTTEAQPLIYEFSVERCYSGTILIEAVGRAEAEAIAVELVEVMGADEFNQGVENHAITCRVPGVVPADEPVWRGGPEGGWS